MFTVGKRWEYTTRRFIRCSP